MEIDRLLDELDNMLMDAPRIPLSNRCIIDTERLGQITDGIRGAVPREIEVARKLIRDHERRINEANEEKKRIIEEARGMAERMVSEQEIYRQAQEKAEAVLVNSSEEALTIRNSADEYSQKTRSDAVEFANEVNSTTETHIKDIFEYLELTLNKATEALQQSKTIVGKQLRGED